MESSESRLDAENLRTKFIMMVLYLWPARICIRLWYVGCNLPARNCTKLCRFVYGEGAAPLFAAPYLLALSVLHNSYRILFDLPLNSVRFFAEKNYHNI